MKSHNIFKQYSWLVNILHLHKKLTLNEINGHWLKSELSEGIPIARSTFNRHRDAILDMFGVIIECDKKDGFRYYIYNEEVLKEDTIQNWMLSTLHVNSILAESKSVRDFSGAPVIASRGDGCFCLYKKVASCLPMLLQIITFVRNIVYNHPLYL